MGGKQTGGAVHRFDNNGNRDAKALCVVTPAAIGPLYFHESAEVINAAAGGPPDRAKMAEIVRRHGLTPLRLSGSVLSLDDEALGSLSRDWLAATTLRTAQGVGSCLTA